MRNLSKHRVLLSGVLSPLLALVFNVILIQILLALSSDPERNWRFRLVVSTLALPVPFLFTLMLARKDRRNGSLSLSAKIGLVIATLSLLLVAKPVMDGLVREKQSRNMAMHDVPAPMFDTSDMQGRRQRLSDYKGSVVLVNIWATWCAPCRSEMPRLDKLYQSRKASGFVVLGLSDEDIVTQQAFLRKVPVTYPLLTMTSGVPNFYREIARYPAIFLIDRNGSLQPTPGQGQVRKGGGSGGRSFKQRAMTAIRLARTNSNTLRRYLIIRRSRRHVVHFRLQPQDAHGQGWILTATHCGANPLVPNQL